MILRECLCTVTYRTGERDRECCCWPQDLLVSRWKRVLVGCWTRLGIDRRSSSSRQGDSSPVIAPSFMADCQVYYQLVFFCLFV